MTEDLARLNFPYLVKFSLQASGANSIEDIALLYGSNSRSCAESIARHKMDNFTPGKKVNVNWEWEFMKSGSLPPGAEIWWQWEIQDDAGATLLTEKQSLIIEDDRFTWKTATYENISVVWTEGGQSFGQSLLQIARDSLDRLSREAGIQFLDNIRLTVYPSPEDVQGAALFLPEWVGGVAFPEYSIIILAIAVGEYDWARQVIPHEIAHLVTGQVVFNCLGIGMPTWLSEGLAVYNEGGSEREEVEQVYLALQQGKLVPLSSLANGFSVDDSEARQAYAYSGEIVRFMIETYGPEKMAELLETMRSGKIIDLALFQVYGLDTKGIDLTWRAAQGVGEAPIPGIAPTIAPTHTPVPTLALWTPVYALPTDTATPTCTSTSTPTATSTATETPTATSTATPTIAVPTPSSSPSPVPSPTPKTKSGRSLPCPGSSAGLAALVIVLLAYSKNLYKPKET